MSESVRRHRDAALLVIAVFTAGAQLAVASRWPRATQHLVAVAISWAAALWLTWLNRDQRHRNRTASHGPSVVAIAVFVCGVATLLLGRSHYSVINRFLPLTMGAAIALMSNDLGRPLDCRRQLVLLGLPLVYPLPAIIEDAVTPTTTTASAAAFLMEILGYEVKRRGTVLEFDGASLTVFDACSGINLMTQMVLLAVVVACLIPIRKRSTVALVLAAIGIGFVVNAIRVAFLGIVAYQAPSQFVYWERYVAGSALFPLIAAALGSLIAWAILRTRPAEACDFVGHARQAGVQRVIRS